MRVKIIIPKFKACPEEDIRALIFNFENIRSQDVVALDGRNRISVLTNKKTTYDAYTWFYDVELWRNEGISEIIKKLACAYQTLVYALTDSSKLYAVEAHVKEHFEKQPVGNDNRFDYTQDYDITEYSVWGYNIVAI